MFVCLQLFSLRAYPGDTPDAAAATAPDGGMSSADRAMQQVEEELNALERRWYGLMRFRWSYPQKLSAGIGAIFVEQPRDMNCEVGCMLYGWHFEIEPGLYGIQGAVGWGKVVGETGRSKHLFHTVTYGWAFRGVVMRTWGDSPLTPQSQTLVGVEGNYSILRATVSLGVMRSLHSDALRGWILTAGLGWGY